QDINVLSTSTWKMVSAVGNTTYLERGTLPVRHLQPDIRQMGQQTCFGCSQNLSPRCRQLLAQAYSSKWPECFPVKTRSGREELKFMTRTRGPVNIVPKSWGRELWIVNNELYCGKILEIHQGSRCSLHFHKLKTETFYLHSGRLRVRVKQAPESV